MIKFRSISILILIIGLGLSINSFGRVLPPRHKNHATIKSSKQKSGHHYRPHQRMKSHHKMHKGQTKHSFLRKR